MKCHGCGSRAATVRYAEVVDGSLTTLHLCEQCASERGVAGSLTSLAGPLVNILMGLLEGEGGAEVKPDARPACPRCGLTYREFRRVGRLGCATCYEAFASELRPLLRRIHGSIEHTGCVPGEVAFEHHRRREITKLQVELADAVKTEDYERAAELRDAIRSAESELEDARATARTSAERSDVDLPDDDG
jgi:protein arginine kinase activator